MVVYGWRRSPEVRLMSQIGQTGFDWDRIHHLHLGLRCTCTRHGTRVNEGSMRAEKDWRVLGHVRTI